MMIKNIKNIFLLFVFIQPFVDVLTSVSMNNSSSIISISMVTRGLILILFMIYILFFSKSNYKRTSIIYIICIIAFSIFYFFCKNNIFYTGKFMQEIIYIFKFFYYIIMFFGYLNLMNEYHIENKYVFNIIILTNVFYSLLIIIPCLTNTSNLSYDIGGNGVKGWFYSTNDITSLLCLLLPYSFYIINRKMKFRYYIVFPIVTIPLMLLGTKTSFIVLTLSMTFLLIYCMFSKIERYIKFLVFVFVCATIIFVPNIPGYKNFERKYVGFKENETNIVKRLMGDSFTIRYDFLLDAKEEYINSSINTKLFGIGFTDRNNTGNYIYEKLIEMDVFDILFRYGIIGAGLIFIPFIYVLYRVINDLCKKKVKMSFDIFLSMFIIVLGLLISIFSGHVLGTPSVSIYIALAMVIIINNIDNQNKVNK